MSDGTRTAGAAAKGKAAAEKQLKDGKPCKGNPYSNQRPGMRDAWQAAFDATLKGEEPAPKVAKPKGKPGRKPKAKPPEAAPGPAGDPVTVDEPIEIIPADDAGSEQD